MAQGGATSIGGASFDPWSNVGHCGPTHVDLGSESPCRDFDLSQGTDPTRVDDLVWPMQPTSGLVAGRTYAISWGVGQGPTDIEVWGTNAGCGTGLGKLAEQSGAGVGVHCLTFTPDKDYSQFLWVVRKGGFVGLQLCPDGTCP